MKRVFHCCSVRWIVVFACLSLFGMAAFSAEDVIADVDLADDEEVGVLHTDKGDLVLRYFPDIAPEHVKSMKSLIKKGFYDGTRFHRIIPGFMIQGGDPNTKENDKSRWGSGGPGYSVKAEFNDKPHVRGTLSMARSNDPNSAGSQFFVCHARAPHLDRKYTNFGQLAYGYKTLDAIATAPALPNPGMPNERSVPIKPTVIKKAEVMTWGGYKKSLDNEGKEEEIEEKEK